MDRAAAARDGVERIGESEISRGEADLNVFIGVFGAGRASGRVVDRKDAEGQRIGNWTEVLAAAKGARTVLNLEEDLALVWAALVGIGRELELAGFDRLHIDELAGRDRSAVKAQGTAGGELAGRNLYGHERVGRNVVRIAKAEQIVREREARVFDCCDRAIAA